MFNSGLYLSILIFAFCFFFLAICRQCRDKVKKICQEEKGDDICKVQVPGGVGDSGSNDCSYSGDDFGCNNVGDELERDVGVNINNQEDDGCDHVCTLTAPNDAVSGRDDNGDSGGNSGDNDVCCGDTSGAGCGYKGNSLVSYICFSGICFFTSYILPI